MCLKSLIVLFDDLSVFNPEQLLTLKPRFLRGSIFTMLLHSDVDSLSELSRASFRKALIYYALHTVCPHLRFFFFIFHKRKKKHFPSFCPQSTTPFYDQALKSHIALFPPYSWLKWSKILLVSSEGDTNPIFLKEGYQKSIVRRAYEMG